ncbi:alpha-1,3-glucan synthase, partial [Aureobasidium melanogenum]
MGRAGQIGLTTPTLANQSLSKSKLGLAPKLNGGRESMSSHNIGLRKLDQRTTFNTPTSMPIFLAAGLMPIGLDDKMHQDSEGTWNFDLYSEFPTAVIVNVWGMNANGVPDKSAAYGDVDGDNVLDWVPPDSLSFNQINFTGPHWPHTGYRLAVNDGSLRYT